MPKPSVCPHGAQVYRTTIEPGTGQVNHLYVCPGGYADRECGPVKYDDEWSKL